MAMSDPYRILIPYFTRSEWGPLTPLLKVMKEDQRLEAITVPKKMDSLQAISDVLAVLAPDMVLCGFDRPEMVPVAYGAYHKHIPIAQIFAGDIAGGAFDDRDRFVISNYADLLFCADEKQMRRVRKATAWRQDLREVEPYCLVSGPTNFDDMPFSVPGDVPAPFDLVLYNPPSLASEKEILKELEEIKRVIQYGEPSPGSVYAYPVVWVAPNGDKYSDLIEDFAIDFSKHFPLGPNLAATDCHVLWRKTMPRNEFLGYLASCNRFIGNSSSMFYEAVYFNVRRVQIGMRNSLREEISKSMCKQGASKIICNSIVNYLDVKKNG